MYLGRKAELLQIQSPGGNFGVSQQRSVWLDPFWLHWSWTMSNELGNKLQCCFTRALSLVATLSVILLDFLNWVTQCTFGLFLCIWMTWATFWTKLAQCYRKLNDSHDILLNIFSFTFLFVFILILCFAWIFSFLSITFSLG